MATYDRTTLIGVFADRAQADRAVEDLQRAGFGDQEIGYAAHGRADGDGTHAGTTPAMDLGGETGDQAADEFKGAAAGAAVGGVFGAAAALLIPGIGPVLAGGILGSALLGAGAGAAAGGLMGALTEMGVSEDEARYYDREFQAGGTIVAVKAGSRYREAAAILERHGATSQAGRIG